MGISKKFFEQSNTKNELSRKNNFLYYGRLTKYKGIDCLLNLLKR